MKRRVIVKPEAKNDIKHHYRYIFDRNEDAANCFLSSSKETFQRLALTPGIGTLRKYNNPELDGLRFVSISGFQNYLAFYLTNSNSVQVVCVLHGAQDIDTILGRHQTA